MPKRHSGSESDDEDQAGNASQHPKRAKTESSDDEEEDFVMPKQETKSNGKSRARRRDDDDDDEDPDADADGEEEGDEAADQQFERQHREKILADLEEKRKIQGVGAISHLLLNLTTIQGVADHGIIEAIEMHQFMCHKYLTFAFGPQINFIIGT